LWEKRQEYIYNNEILGLCQEIVAPIVQESVQGRADKVFGVVSDILPTNGATDKIKGRTFGRYYLIAACKIVFLVTTGRQSTN
jgi:hypothetical protein